MKLYIVSCVGLSDTEYDANGYNEVHPFTEKYDAVKKMKSLRNNEIDNCEGREYQILKDTPNEFRMSWDGHGEQIRIYLHEVEL